jgi:general secretion pathway protein H
LRAVAKSRSRTAQISCCVHWRCLGVRKDWAMINSSDVRRAWRVRLPGLLSMVIWLGAVIGSASQQRLPADPALPPQAEADLRPAPGEISVQTRDPLDEAAAEVRRPLVRYLLKELIAERLANAQPWADFEVAGPRDALAQREVRLADAAAAQAEIEAGLDEQSGVAKQGSARAQSQNSAMHDQSRKQDREFADVRSEAEADLRQRLNTAFTEPKRNGAENNGPSRAAVGTSSAAVKAAGNQPEIEHQRRTFEAAAGESSLDHPELPDALQSSTSIDALAVVLLPKSPLRDYPSGTAGDVVPARAGTNTVIEDNRSTHASSPQIAVNDSEPTTAHTIGIISDTPGPGIRHVRSALAPAPIASRVVAPNQTTARNGSASPLNSRDRSRLNEAATRLADGLRVTREEAISERQERVFTVDVEERVFAAASTVTPVSLDPAFNIHLLTAKSELAGESRGAIRFFADGSSTGGRIELELLGERASINVQWATGAVTVED